MTMFIIKLGFLKLELGKRGYVFKINENRQIIQYPVI